MDILCQYEESSVIAASRVKYNSSPTSWVCLSVAGYKKGIAIFSRMKLSTELVAKCFEVRMVVSIVRCSQQTHKGLWW